MPSLEYESLCEPCKRVVSEQLLDVFGYAHHHELSKLQNSAKSCTLCKAFYDALLEAYSPIPLSEDSKYRISDGEKKYSSLTSLRKARLSMKKIAAEDGNRSVGLLIMRDGGKGDVVDRAIWRTDDIISFEDRAAVIRKWISNCDQESSERLAFTMRNSRTFSTPHQNCYSRKPYLGLPTRLIHLDQGTEGVHVKLMESRSFKEKDHNVPYTTLSHRWGHPDRRPVLTTKASLQRHMDGIHFEEFPRTFWDAIRITWALGIRYIWIDSLCIIQDDPEDWQKEAARMSDVYRGSCLNIAAADAEDSTGGCSLDTIAPAMEVTGIPGNSSLRIRIPAADAERVSKAPLNSRGWVFQELILADRVLYCAEDQFYWQCRGRSTSEDGYMDHTEALNFRGMTSNQHRDWTKKKTQLKQPDEILNRWWYWANDYIKRDFTFDSDRLAAMAGFLELHEEDLLQVGEIAPNSFLGLWKETLVEDLMWTVDRMTLDGSTFEPQHAGDPNIPSWTWLSYKSCELRRIPHFADHSCAEVIEMGLNWSSEPLTSNLLSTRLILRAPLKRFKFKRKHFGYRFFETAMGFQAYGLGVRAKGQAMEIIQPCLLLWCDDGQDGLKFLVLDDAGVNKEEGQEIRKYRRIGIYATDNFGKTQFFFGSNPEFDFRDAPIETVQLV